MANPNRTVAAFRARKVWNEVKGFNGPTAQADAEAFAAEKRAEGFNCRVTSYRYGPRKEPMTGWNVHFHPKASA